MAQTWAQHGPSNWSFLKFVLGSRDAPCQICPKGKGRAKNIPGMSVKKSER